MRPGDVTERKSASQKAMNTSERNYSSQKGPGEVGEAKPICGLRARRNKSSNGDIYQYWPHACGESGVCVYRFWTIFGNVLLCLDNFCLCLVIFVV